MREKVLLFMSLTGFDSMVDPLIESITGQFRIGFESNLGEKLPSDAAEAIKVVNTALVRNQAALRDEVAGVYETHFTEQEIDEMISFYKSPVGEKLSASGVIFQTAISEASDRWSSAVIKTVEGDLARILGVNTPAPVDIDDTTRTTPNEAA